MLTYGPAASQMKAAAAACEGSDHGSPGRSTVHWGPEQREEAAEEASREAADNGREVDHGV